MRKRVLVAMSGGVDSSVASYLLKERGFEVAGLTMCLGGKETNRKRPTCCSAQAIDDAKKVCHKLKIPHYVMDFSKYLEREVINRFVSEYHKGRTPNPCIDCNRSLKFNILLKKALSLGFNFLATGHYAKVVGYPQSSVRLNLRYFVDNYVLKKAKDKKKDQSYFLYPIKKAALKSVLFPLGKFTKAEVRNIARKINLPIADKPQSQDICFIPERSYHRFLSDRIGATRRGPILNLKGNILGEHKGAFFYTIGQRGGLGIGYKHPLYVLSINTEENWLVVGEKKDLKTKGLLASEMNLLVEDLPKKVSAKIRYNHKEAMCTVSSRDNGKRLEVIFDEEQEAVTPGQSVVLYDRDVVLGGGVIDEVVK